MGTWIAVAGAAFLVVSLIWLIVVYVARLSTWTAALGATCIACIAGGAIGSTMVYIAIDHNPQEEFVKHVADEVSYLGLSEVFLSWFVVVSLAVALALVLGAFRGLGTLYRRSQIV
jgi:hypothetical protein